MKRKYLIRQKRRFIGYRTPARARPMYEPLESILAERARLMTALLARTPDEHRRADIRQAFQEENEEIRAAYHAGTLHRQFHRVIIKTPSRRA